MQPEEVSCGKKYDLRTVEASSALLRIGPGNSHPLGSSLHPDGVNFSVFSRNCDFVELLLFDSVDAVYPSKVITLDRVKNKTYHYWHVFVPGLKPGQLYGFRVHGPFEPRKGLLFDPGKVLLDPYGKAVAVPEGYSRNAACGIGEISPHP